PISLGEQRFPDRVVDLVGAGVVQVLALEQNARAAQLVGEPVRRGDGGRAAHIVAQQARVLGEELLVVPRLLIGGGDLRHRPDERVRQDRAALGAQAPAGAPGKRRRGGGPAGLGYAARGGGGD